MIRWLYAATGWSWLGRWVQVDCDCGWIVIQSDDRSFTVETKREP